MGLDKAAVNMHLARFGSRLVKARLRYLLVLVRAKMGVSQATLGCDTSWFT